MSESSDLFVKAYQIISDRQVWENRQRQYFLMRHDGLPRRRKPFQSAADLHLALIDEHVTKQAAFTMAQLLGSPRLANLACLRQQLKDVTDSAQDWYDFELKHRTNLIEEMDTIVDTMWLRGRGVVKSYVDPFDDYRIVHENVDPLFILMDDAFNDFDDAMWWVHVRQINVEKFKQDRRYFDRFRKDVDDEETNRRVSLMRGGKDALERLKTYRGRDFDQIQQDKELREGITHSTNPDTIIIWDHYVRTMGGIWCYPYCPVAMDVEVRQPYGVPYKVDGRVSSGFFSFKAERKDKGWYSPRGLGEKLSDYEIYGTKVWNSQADDLTFRGTAMLTSEMPIQNPANYRIRWGEYIPGNAKFMNAGSASPDFGNQLNFARGEAEIRAQSPDMGIEKPNNRSGDKRTAKEVSVASSLSQIGQSHTSGLFKEDFAKLLRHDWGLCLQFKRKSLTYFVSEDLQTVPEEALHGEYLITAGGSTEDWDKSQRIGRATQRLEMFKGAPNINQDELFKDVLQADDGRLVKRLLLPQNQRQNQEAEDENIEISQMIVTHYPAPVLPQEDHATRAKILIDFMFAHTAKGVQVDLMAKQRLQEHLMAHLQLLKKINPKAFKQIVQYAQQQEMKAGMIARQPKPRTAIGRLTQSAGQPAPTPQPQQPAPQFSML